jgi:hypothetical protein
MLGGIILSFVSIAYSIFNFVLSLVYYRKLAPPGIQMLITALFFFSGVQLLFLGVMGEYVSAIHFQVRKRPLVIERARINFTTQPDAIDKLGELHFRQ